MDSLSFDNAIDPIGGPYPEEMLLEACNLEVRNMLFSWVKSRFVGR